MQLPLLEFLAGLALGLFVAFLFLRRDPQETKRLREELEQVKAEYRDYRAQVNGHFAQSSLLFKGVADGYRQLYEHLSQGATTLCQPETTLPKLDVPENILPVPAQPRTPAAKSDAGQTVEPPDETEAEWEANAAVSYLSSAARKKAGE